MPVLAGDDNYTWTDGDGGVLDLTDRTRWAVSPADGFGLSAIELVIRETPAGHGGTYAYSRLKPKDFTLHILAKAGDWPTQIARRTALVAAFSPIKGKGTWQIVRADGTTRSIDCVIRSGLRFMAAGRKGMSRIEDIDFTAPAGTWYDPTVVSGTLAFFTTAGPALPQTLPFSLGSGNVPAVYTLTNNGDWDSFPVFTIPGPAVNPTLFNKTTSQYVRWNGTVQTGQTLTLDCSFDAPVVSITDIAGNVYNTWGQLDRSSAFFPIKRGANTVVYTQSNVNPNSITYSYYHRFSGI